MMDKTQWLNHIETVIAQGPYSASMKSLKAYTSPRWYEDGRFGIFIHWGPYCVPAFENEWYPRNMYQPGTSAFKHHQETYGPHKAFGYKDFIPMFRAERFNAEEWAELFERSGAKYVVPVAEHHDGFQMYKSGWSHWNAFKMGPERDICGELAEAVREKGMVFGASNHRAEHFWFMDGVHKCDSDYTQALEAFYGPAEPAPEDHHSLTQGPPTAEYMDDWLIRNCEFVDQYHPQLIWFDWWINHMAFRPYLEKFAAFYYNRGAQWGVEVAINYKYNAYDKGSAIFDVERGQLAAPADMLWQNDTSVSKNSWGYIARQEYKKPVDILCDLCDIVAKNGALLLNIGPKADGSIPQEEREILGGIGTWLKQNGDAIYGARPWRVFGEGPTKVPDGAFTDTTRDAFTGADIRYTAREDTLYAMILGRPAQRTVLLSAVKPEDGYASAAAMDGREVRAEQGEDGMRLDFDDWLLSQELPLVVRLQKR